MKTEKRKFGDFGEEIAERYLIDRGYKIITRNYIRPFGEIDIVSQKGNLIVFCEVKTRDKKNVLNYLPEYSINKAKIRNLQKICETYLYENLYPNNQEWQIDVISVIVDKTSNNAKINHIENAVWEKQY